MKRIIFILLFYTTLIIYVSAQNISNVTAQQVDKTIHVTYNLDMQADIALLISMDGGRTFTEFQKVYGAVGKDVRSGRVTIVWDVLAERESLVGDVLLFFYLESHYKINLLLPNYFNLISNLLSINTK